MTRSNLDRISRATFIRRALGSVVLLTILRAGASPWDGLRGDRVGWARLRTPSEHWMRHASSDPVLMQFLRDHTSLNIDPTWYVADVENLEEMTGYPLLFSQGVHMVYSVRGRANIAEYVRRGGFLLIDACCNPLINQMNHDEFLRRQRSFLASVLPEARVMVLPPDHPVYRCFFTIPGGRPPHTFMNNVYDPRKASYGLYGIQIGGRMAGMISLSGLQCGWDKMIAPPGHDVVCMRMLVNIYLAAMLQGGEGDGLSEANSRALPAQPAPGTAAGGLPSPSAP
ncbi:MAG: DUF4159 domain-containing protein [Verrucomicrobia bacterium]|nr:DUF4159 domain-containing protein [Verrucomicrobiota bacterium]